MKETELTNLNAQIKEANISITSIDNKSPKDKMKIKRESAREILKNSMYMKEKYLKYKNKYLKLKNQI